jgi:hypothetical protein
MMREFMRTFAFFFLDFALLISLSACVFDDNHRASSGLGEAPPATPQMIEFATDMGMSWNPGFQRGTWRSEIDDVRAAGRVRIISEVQCPDRYRVAVTGAEHSDQVFIDKTMYQRNRDGTWAVRPMPMRHMVLNSCGKSNPPTNDPARFRLLAEQFGDLEFTGPERREINGHECREWTRSVPNSSGPLPLIMCFDIKTHAILQTRYGDQTTTYDYDAKVDIKPPR